MALTAGASSVGGGLGMVGCINTVSFVVGRRKCVGVLGLVLLKESRTSSHWSKAKYGGRHGGRPGRLGIGPGLHGGGVAATAAKASAAPAAAMASVAVVGIFSHISYTSFDRLTSVADRHDHGGWSMRRRCGPVAEPARLAVVGFGVPSSSFDMDTKWWRSVVVELGSTVILGVRHGPVSQQGGHGINCRHVRHGHCGRRYHHRHHSWSSRTSRSGHGGRRGRSGHRSRRSRHGRSGREGRQVCHTVGAPRRALWQWAWVRWRWRRFPWPQR